MNEDRGGLIRPIEREQRQGCLRRRIFCHTSACLLEPCLERTAAERLQGLVGAERRPPRHESGDERQRRRIACREAGNDVGEWRVVLFPPSTTLGEHPEDGGTGTVVPSHEQPDDGRAGLLGNTQRG
jgi:hypothetical protein